ncbi:golvesin C-terminal-like domain-containing protein [Actinoallomurus soli]|uniref:golvesin C-terminal-like domain-containing protein n=1 Tax=Actinoallomurus soli TaxID=2952535 RepID=UPI0020936FF2|nr:DNRLRE domain-containing protein [Actinoallomurus soli]MCO5974143.1 DNRLRE domain-containing protein [Actinoallomurus soli]
MSRLLWIKRWNWPARVLVLTLVVALTPALPARAETARPPGAQAGGDWKPASKRNWWDRLWGLHEGKKAPKQRDLKVGGVPRQEPVPKGRKMPPAKRVGELTGRRTANARYYKLSDGSVQAEISAQQVNYRAGHGWKPIDTQVTKSDAGGFSYGNATNSFRSLFGSKAGRLVRFDAGGGASLTFGPEGAGSVTPKADRNTVTYAGAAGGADLTYTVQPNALKESIVLAKAPMVASWSFAVQAAGLRAWQRPDGAIAFYRGGFDGPPVLVMPRPFMTDARNDAASPYGKAWSPKVSQSMRWDAKAGLLHITVSADQKWLKDPKRVYPVVIDPTVVLQPLPEDSQDVMIESDTPTSNYESSWRLSVGTTPGGVARSLVKFPMTGIPAGTHVLSADLQMYYDQTHTSNSSAVTIEAHRATTAWDETTANWSNASNNVGELGYYRVYVDNGVSGHTAAKGSWPASTSTLAQYGYNGDYLYNKDDVTGDTYTWWPTLAEGGDYQVETHYVAANDRATNAPYTVTYNGGTASYAVNQQSGTNGVWASLGTHPFAAGSAGKVVLGDGPASSSTSVIADAVRWTKNGSVVRPAGDQGSHWHSFAVRNIVQSWVDGTNPNYGFVLKAADEATLGMGGPRYEGSVYAYNGETAQYPKLVITYGRNGVAVNEPTTIHSTGADLTWPTYTDPSSSSGDDIVEYQVHRSIYQDFTPSAATLVAPVDKNTTAFSDTTATPTPADSADPYGNLYYYMVAVKTKDGQVIPGPTQIVRLPKAGRTVKVYPASADTTLSSTQSTTNEDKLAGQAWLSVGNDSGTYGVTHSVIKFPAMTDIPTSAKVVDGRVALWSAGMTGNAQATYDVHGLTRDFSETSATWKNATSTTAWTTAGGDYNSTVAGSFGPITNDPARRTFPITSLAQSWVTTPSTNHGVLFRLANDTSPAEHTTFLSREADEPDLRPQLFVTYLDTGTDSTYYAPYTPSRMIPGDQYTINVDLSDTTATTWTKADYVLSYRWTLPDGTDVTNGGNQLQTALPKDIVPGDTVTVAAQLKTPIQSDSGNKRTDYVLHWDLYDKTTGQWLSASNGIGSLDQAVAVEDPTSNQLGLEKFYQYAGKNTGAGATVMNNLYAGNAVWSYNPINNPGRGISTFVRMAYNSQDTSDSAMGSGWSLQAAAPTRLGSPLDFHPNPDPTTVTMTDGDGTSHTFTWDASANGGAGEWKAPAGVHYYLQRQVVCDNKTEESRAWVMTRPDRTQFFYDCDGYLSAIVDKNGNTQTYTYAARKSNNKPIKFLTYITDPAGRQSLTLTYYAKGDDYTYIDDAGNEVSDSNLTNPHIIDHVKSVTDISGRTITFTYTTQGLMAKMVDGAGDSQAKTFKFTYDATQGNKNVKLVKVTDPRGHDTKLDYYYPQTGDDPKFHWNLKTVTDRLGYDTGFAYTDPDGTSGSTIQAVVTDPQTHVSTYVMDGYGRPTQLTNAKSQVTKLGWDADNNVTRLEEDNGAVSTWTYDPLTGYPTSSKDAEANKNSTAGTTFGYQTGLGGHFADLISKQSPEGRLFTFGYDSLGNLTSVTDPDGNATSTAGDYTSTSAYDGYGQLSKATDANGHATQYLDYDPNGYPQTITDPLNKSTKYVYDVRGQVTTVTDPYQHDTTQNYDVFGRPTNKTVPKAAGVVITTPAPEYDANDNVIKSTAPNGAVTTAIYDEADQVTSSTVPPDTSTSPQRTTSYEYDKAGNVTKVTQPNGTLTTTDTTDYVTSYGYDELYEQTSVTNAKGDTLTYAYDDVGNVTTVIDPRKNATADTTDYTTKYTYDLNHRVKTTTDAAGKTTSADYDRDGLTVATYDQDGTKTSATLDARGKPTQVTVPHASGSDNITQFEYDQVGNQTKVITPRGVATTGVADDFVQETQYDELNRVKEKLTPYDPNDARYNHADATIYSYDDAGRLAKVSAPPSNGQTVRNDTTYSYFDNGWTKTSTDPWDIVTSYDYNELGQQTSRTLTSAGGSSSRTMGWTYYPDGKLKGRTDDGVPVGQQVVLADDSDIQNAGYTGTAWTSASAGTGFQGYDYATHAAGTGANSFAWNLTIPEDGTYQVFVKYPDGVSGAATNASYTVRDGSGGTMAKTVDQSTGGGTWVSLGSYTFKRDGTGQQVTLSDAANGTVLADAVKLVRDNSGDTDNEKTDFAYGYDPNGNLTDITDNSPGTKIDAYAVTYDGLNQVSKVEEKAAGTVKHTTIYTYNENGEPATRGHDDESATYEYDARDLVSKITDKASSTDTSPKVTTFTYTNRGQRDIETKGNGNTVDADYFLDGSLQHQVEKKPNGTIVSEHTYSYDPNGNKTQDVATTMNADNHAAYLNTTTDYTYDPLDRIAQVTKTGASSDTETYLHDANNNVVSQTLKGTTTTLTYDRNRLLTSATGGTTANYNYDPFGRLDTVTAAGKVIERNTYDGFDRIAQHEQQNSAGSLVATKYTYDPLDRTQSKTTDPGGANEKTTNYSYLGLSGQVLNEDVAGTITKSYQYSPWGQRLSQVKTNTDGSKEDAYYGYNDHTDVETLTDSSGDTKATYGYTAYGQADDAETTGIDKPDPTDPTKEPYNAYRYEAKRWDSSSSTYDMGFRDYDPGLNQFLTRDSYSGALDDQNLTTDPFTANRYAFGGGNPITSIELDGHNICGSSAGSGGDNACAPNQRPDGGDTSWESLFKAAYRSIGKDPDKLTVSRTTMRATAIVYNEQGKVIAFDPTFFSGKTNEGLGEHDGRDTHVEKRIMKYYKDKGYLREGNTLVILTNGADESSNPCPGSKGCDVALEKEAEDTGASIVYQAAGKKAIPYGPSTDVSEKYVAGRGIKAEDMVPRSSGDAEGPRGVGGVGRIGSKLLGGLGAVGDLYMLYEYGWNENPWRPGWQPPPCDPRESYHIAPCTPGTI